MNTRVEDKSGEELVNIISENVGRMLRRKMDAVACIRMAAEKIAEEWDPSFVDEGNFSYVSGKNMAVDDSAEEQNASVYRWEWFTRAETPSF